MSQSTTDLQSTTLNSPEEVMLVDNILDTLPPSEGEEQWKREYKSEQ